MAKAEGELGELMQLLRVLCVTGGQADVTLLQGVKRIRRVSADGIVAGNYRKISIHGQKVSIESGEVHALLHDGYTAASGAEVACCTLCNRLHRIESHAVCAVSGVGIGPCCSVYVAGQILARPVAEDLAKQVGAGDLQRLIGAQRSVLPAR